MGDEDGGVHEPVEVVPYDAGWPAAFETERSLILKAFAGNAVEVHHIGSTAVPGLASKPIVDIMIAADSIDDRTAFEEVLSPLGYVNVPHDDDSRRLFFRKGIPRTHHAHVVRRNSWTYWKHLMFRDELISSPQLREEYERLKVRLAAEFRDDREGYTNAKAEFVERSVYERARGKKPGP
jgi:GrpB-like predicted nucleotidyltransferase (UPF0157 family)